LVFVNCTSRKRRPAPTYLRVTGLNARPARAVAAQWVQRLHRASVLYPAAQLYCGRSVTEALSATDGLRGGLYFISAGLGLVAADARVPAYNLTVAPASSDSVLRCISDGPADAAAWWSALTDALGTPRPFASTVTRATGLVLLAMPGTYVDMLASELESLPAASRERLRVLGPRKAEELPDFLRTQWMPYDRRLQGLPGFAGTESDFPQRALRHFAACVLPSESQASAAAHAAMVDDLLGTRTVERRAAGQRMSDNELTPLIRRLWRKQNGNRGRILRELRDSLGVACEQSRFKRLADQLEEEKRDARSA
jgi:hypothetical protein